VNAPPERGVPSRRSAASDVAAFIATLAIGASGSFAVGIALEMRGLLAARVIGVLEFGVLLFALAVALQRWSERRDWSTSLRVGATIASMYVVLRLVLLGFGV
jgi:hypothetical protein